MTDPDKPGPELLHNYTEPSTLDEDSRLALLKACRDMHHTMESSRKNREPTPLYCPYPVRAMRWDVRADMHSVAGHGRCHWLRLQNDHAVVARAHQVTGNLLSPPQNLAKETHTDSGVVGYTTPKAIDSSSLELRSLGGPSSPKTKPRCMDAAPSHMTCFLAETKQPKPRSPKRKPSPSHSIGKKTSPNERASSQPSFHLRNCSSSSSSCPPSFPHTNYQNLSGASTNPLTETDIH